MIFSKQLRSEDHTRAFVVGEADDCGWEVREEEDDRVVKRTRLHDWHRVETTIMRFMIETTQLRSAGWTDIQPT